MRKVLFTLTLACAAFGLFLRRPHAERQGSEASRPPPIAAAGNPIAPVSPTAIPSVASSAPHEAVADASPEPQPPESDPRPPANPLAEPPKHQPLSGERLRAVSSRQQIEEFLDDTRFEDLGYFFSEGKRIAHQAPEPGILNLQGVFRGPETSLGGATTVRYLSFSIDLSKALFEIETSEDGVSYRKVPATHSGCGYRNIDRLGLAVVCDGTLFLDLFYLPEKDLVVGNVYQGSFQGMKALGKCILSRAE